MCSEVNTLRRDFKNGTMRVDKLDEMIGEMEGSSDVDVDEMNAVMLAGGEQRRDLESHNPSYVLSKRKHEIPMFPTIK